MITPGDVYNVLHKYLQSIDALRILVWSDGVSISLVSCSPSKLVREFNFFTHDLQYIEQEFIKGS